MAKFVARRLLMLVVALLVSSFVIFISLDLAPGNPLATLSGGHTLTPAAGKRRPQWNTTMAPAQAG